MRFEFKKENCDIKLANIVEVRENLLCQVQGTLSLLCRIAILAQNLIWLNKNTKFLAIM